MKEMCTPEPWYQAIAEVNYKPLPAATLASLHDLPPLEREVLEWRAMGLEHRHIVLTTHINENQVRDCLGYIAKATGLETSPAMVRALRETDSIPPFTSEQLDRAVTSYSKLTDLDRHIMTIVALDGPRKYRDGKPLNDVSYYRHVGKIYKAMGVTQNAHIARAWLELKHEADRFVKEASVQDTNNMRPTSQITIRESPAQAMDRPRDSDYDDTEDKKLTERVWIKQKMADLRTEEAEKLRRKPVAPHDAQAKPAPSWKR